MEFTLIFTWWILLLILSLIGLPITSSLFWRLSDKGASAALTFSLTALFFSIYWLGHFSFNLSTVLIGLATLVLLSLGVLFLKRPELPLKRFSESFAVFTMAFMLIVAIRSVDPSIYPIGGEKFLDFGLLQSILRSSILPPEDLWFAGETVRYYYGGHLISAILSMLSGISAKFAYNLALASFFGALVSGAYGLSGSLSTFYGHSHRFAGSLGAIIVGISSNFVVTFSIFLWALPLGLANSVARFVGNVTDLKPLYLLHPDSFFYWTSSRVIRGTINEFPFFAWLNGDLHAHMMSTPFMILILFTMFAYYLSPANSVRERRLLILVILPFLSGLLAVVNTWSYPTVFGLLFLTLVFSPTDPLSIISPSLNSKVNLESFRREIFRIVTSISLSIFVILLGSLTVIPFFIQSASLRTIAFFPPRSGLIEFLLVYLFFILIFSIYMYSVLSTELSQSHSRILLLCVLLFFAGLLFGAPAVAILLPLCIVSWLLLEHFSSKVGFELVLFLAGAVLILLTEFLFIQEQAGPGRMNTVFKIYMQVWIFFSIGASIALTRLFSDQFLKSRSPSKKSYKLLTTLFLSLLVISTTFYAGFSIGEHFSNEPKFTLDATLDATINHPHEWDAITFIGDQPGSPTIVTAPGCWCNSVETTLPYRWVNAPSSFTGIPTIAGWSHEVGYRGEEPYLQRVTHVNQIYTGSSELRKELLLFYDVKYVYVGKNERSLYQVSAFDDPYLKLVFENEEVVVYEHIP